MESIMIKAAEAHLRRHATASHKRTWIRPFILSVMCLILFIIAVSPAFATFPGINGRLAYIEGGLATNGIYVTGIGQVHTGVDTDIQWSPSGAQMAFGTNAAGAIVVAREDGTHPQIVVEKSYF